MSKKGWIKIHRDIQDHWIFTENRVFSKYEAWTDILMTVNHESSKVLIGSYIIECARGQSLLSLDSWGRRWKWSKSSVKRFFDVLSKEKMIAVENVLKTTRITVCKYDTYQDSRNANETQMKQDRNEDETDLKQDRNDTETELEPNKNDKNIENDKNEEECKEESSSPEHSSVDGEEKISELDKSRLPKGLNKEARSFFEKFYKEKFNESYYFDKVNAGQLSSLLKKINFKIREKQKIEHVDFDASMDGFAVFVRKVYDTRDSFIDSNFTIPILSSKFNELFVKISTNGKTRIVTGQNRQQRVDEVANLRGLAKSIIRNGD